MILAITIIFSARPVSRGVFAVFVALASAACSSPAHPSDGGIHGIDGSSADVIDVAPPPPLLDPTTIPKFTQPLVVVPEMPPTSMHDGIVEYRIAARQFHQQILPPPLPPTTVWGYGRAGDPLPGQGSTSTFHTPSFTIEARRDRPVRVTWINGLMDEQRHYQRELLPLDTTLHWADPGHAGHADHASIAATGPVPLVPHVHGAHAFDHSDGYPEAWFLPDAVDIPAGFAPHGSAYRTQLDVGPGAAVFDYPNDQRAATLWYHDHALGITRLNVYAGLAGFWILRDSEEDALDLPGPAPHVGDAPDSTYYEIPLAIQDRRFRVDGELAYPTSRDEFGDYHGPYAPDSEVPPVWNPEVFGNVMVVNGRAWPYFEVEPRLYRFRILNASNARTLRLFLDRPGISFVQIGSDGGLLPDAPVSASELLVAPAQRFDVLVDFSTLHEGETVLLRNRAPDEPYGGPDADPPQSPSDQDTTGQVMQFRVVARTAHGRAGSIPATLPPLAPLSTSLAPRDLVLVEEATAAPEEAPHHVLLGTAALGPLHWDDTETERVHLGDTEIWRIANLTEDAHPIHLHLVSFRVLDRIPFDVERYQTADEAWRRDGGSEPTFDAFVTGPGVPRMPSESGAMDTVFAMPGTITRIEARFDRAGLYVWHCHMLEHEDNDMMRPLRVTP